MKSRKVFLLVVLFFVSAALCWALDVGGTVFQDQKQVKGMRFKLQGAGLKRFLTIKVVAAGLYLAEGVTAQQIFNNVPKRIEVVYLQHIPKIELARATTRGIEDNVSKEELQNLDKRISQMNALYVDVKPQDRYSITYLPGQGTRVELNGVVQGMIDGEDFGKAFFAIWVGNKPADAVVRQKLLGEWKK